MERVEGIDESRRSELERSIAAYLHDEAGVESGDANRRAHDFLHEAAGRLGSGLELITRWWWVRLLQGVLALMVSVLFFTRPIQAFEALVLTLGAWAIIDGTFLLVGALTQRSWQLAVGGVAGIVLGYLVLSRPLGAAVAFFYLAAIWAMARGIGEIAFGASLHRKTHGRTALLAAGIISLLFGLALLLLPLVGVLALGYTLGVYAMVWGVCMIGVAIMMRSVGRDLRERVSYFGGPRPATAG
jgi:uncharacterized membrane protein HdeD (DUF308 family)